MISSIALSMVILVGGVEPPPARYDHAPTVRLHVIEGTDEQIQRVCRRASRYDGDLKILACAMASDDACIIIWPKGQPRAGRLWRHERAHCNGWEHTQ